MMFSQCGPQRFISTNDAYDYLPTYFEEGGIKNARDASQRSNH